ncbi:hypothetical protein VKT23_013863 [Stygiomarasmius scandens]|uniref:Gag protein n=1 Tax=Marasmiellus scandens TaxID=2682957 RepID=A0ABR1J2K7_9AGAR
MSTPSQSHRRSHGLPFDVSLQVSPTTSCPTPGTPPVSPPWPRDRYRPPLVHTYYLEPSVHEDASQAPGLLYWPQESLLMSQANNEDMPGYVPAAARISHVPSSMQRSPIRNPSQSSQGLMDSYSQVPMNSYSQVPMPFTSGSPDIRSQSVSYYPSPPQNTLHSHHSVPSAHSYVSGSPAHVGSMPYHSPVAQVHQPTQLVIDGLTYAIPELSQGAITIAQGTMKDLEVLKGTDNLVTWESQVFNIITSLSLTGHICSDPPPGEQRTIFNIPVVPPADPTSTAFTNWRRNDQIVSGLILQRLVADVRRSILPALTNGRPTTAREHWSHIQQHWGLANDVRVKAMLRKLFAMKANSINDLDMYITKYRNTLNTISGSRRELDWSEILQNLADGLPRQLPLMCPVYLAISRQADQGPALCEREHFENAVMELQNLWVRESSSYERKQKKEKGKADLTCEGCGGPGRAFENC